MDLRALKKRDQLSLTIMMMSPNQLVMAATMTKRPIHQRVAMRNQRVMKRSQPRKARRKSSVSMRLTIRVKETIASWRKTLKLRQ